MSGQVKSYKPNTKATQVQRDLNAAVRATLDFRTSWSALITRATINIPNAYATGGITTVANSPNIIGVGTSWPYNDVVNTTMVNGNRTTGYVEITPASMNGIVQDTLLFVNDGGYSEAVAVVDVSNSTFTAVFQYPHNNGTSLTCSSLAGLQLQFNPQTPIFTLLGVSSATGSNNTGIIDNPFAGDGLTNTGYQLVKAYITMPNFRSWISVVDPLQQFQLATNVSQQELNASDPARTAQGTPQCMADLSPSASGSFQSEIYPWQTVSYALAALYNKNWPEMTKPTDRPPYFFNPSIFIDYAIAAALRRKDLRDNNDTDPYYNPQLAKEFEQKWLMHTIAAANADEERCQQALSSSVFQTSNVGNESSAYWQNHVWGPGGGW